MYIKLEDDMTLVITVPGTLRRGDNMNQQIIFLIPNQIGEIDTSAADIVCKCVTPYGFLTMPALTHLAESYNDLYEQYTLDVTDDMTECAGSDYLWLEITDLSERKAITSECVLTVEETREVNYG